MRKSWWWVVVGALLGVAVFGITRLPFNEPDVQQAALLAPPPQKRALLPPPPVPEPPPAEPSSEVPTLVEASQEKIDIRIKALAGELADMWTRNPEELVVVIDDAARSIPSGPSVTLLLAIAHAETNGKILDVSGAGAVGLAQATPVAYLQEKGSGKLFVNRDYLIGSRAYIMKKPLGDADTIASMVVAKDDAKTRRRARHLLSKAKELRREGIDELDLMDPFGSKKYFDEIERMDKHNRATLKRLERLLDDGSKAQLRAFRNDVRKEYRALKETQVTSWTRYQKTLIAKRDAMLEKQFEMPHARVKKELAYEASEYLGEHLDARFSAKQMAAFLVVHLDRKAHEARKLAPEASDRQVERMTAALYNGGSHNVKRMLAGLIRSLPETEKYMQKVPATRRRLDGVVAGAAMNEAGLNTLR